VGSPFAFDRTWRFDVGTERLWDALTCTDAYTRWWDWLRSCDVDGVRAGAIARCEVRAPLPYTLRFEIAIDEVVEGSRIATTVRGDLAGPALLEVLGDGKASEARLSWSLRLAAPGLRRLAVVARPAMVWAHHRIVDVGVRQFEEQALGGRD